MNQCTNSNNFFSQILNKVNVFLRKIEHAFQSQSTRSTKSNTKSDITFEDTIKINHGAIDYN